MRNRVSNRIPRVRISLLSVALFAMMLALAGCGGGGGGGVPNPNPNPNPNPGGGATTMAALTGTVRDSLGDPVIGALVSIVGTGLQTQTGDRGIFNFAAVPLTATRFVVNSPNLSRYFDIAQYQGGRPYDVDPARPGGQGTLPLPALAAGSITLPATVILYSVSAGPPPPPSGTCP